jgi:hypothetical protein
MVKSPIYEQLDETGSILIRTNLPPNQPLPKSIQKEFARCTVFYATMLRAISAIINPRTGQPYSIYNYHVTESILLGSGKFVKVSEDITTIWAHRFLYDLHKRLYPQLFDMNLGEKESRKISSILTGLSKEAMRMIEANSDEEFKAGFITFIVEYINGFLNISVRSVYINSEDYKRNSKRERCRRRFRIKTPWRIQTESYLFISEIK